MNRYVFIGAVEISMYCLRALLKMDIDIVDIMCPAKESSSFNSDYCDLGAVARDFGKDVYYFNKVRDEVEHIRECRPDVIFILGLSQIIPEDILNIPTIGTIGSHPALLPKNRGRHPLIWAIANGLKKSGVTLFWIDKGVDSGDIWDQEEYEISDEDDARSVYDKVKDVMVRILKINIPKLENGIVKRERQYHALANQWRKRSKKDGEIDWRMSSAGIHNLVRALSEPYVGAHCVVDGNEVKIWKSRIISDYEDMQNIEPGKVMYTRNGGFAVKTGDGVIEIVKHEFREAPKEGEYL